MIYKASLDNLSKIITASVTVLFASLILFQVSIIKDEGRAIPIYTTTALIAIYLLMYGFSIIRYEINRGSIIIHRLFGNVIISKEDIYAAELIAGKNLQWSVRIFGVGGLFGYFGRFTNIKMGRMTWYATRRDKPVLIRTNNGSKIILTPDDPERFIAMINHITGNKPD